MEGRYGGKELQSVLELEIPHGLKIGTSRFNGSLMAVFVQPSVGYSAFLLLKYLFWVRPTENATGDPDPTRSIDSLIRSPIQSVHRRPHFPLLIHDIPSHQ